MGTYTLAFIGLPVTDHLRNESVLVVEPRLKFSVGLFHGVLPRSKNPSQVLIGISHSATA